MSGASTGLKTRSGAAVRPGLGTPGNEFGDVVFWWINEATTADRRLFSGWVSEVGQQDEFDRVGHAAKIDLITVKHKGDGNIKKYWALERVTLFVIAAGVPSRAILARHGDLGIRYWFGYDPQKDRKQSHLCFRAVIQGLDWPKPFLFTTAGQAKTNAMYQSLVDHFKIIDALDAAREGEHPYFMAGLPLAPSPEQVQSKSRKSGASSPVTVPFAAFPDPITDEFLREVWIGKQGLVDLCDEQIDATVEWSKTIPEGTLLAPPPDAQESEEAETEEIAA